MEHKLYQVYKYKWSDGKYYYGRTYKGSGRIGDVKGYQNQYVGRYMNDHPFFDTEIIYESYNIYAVYYKEYELINKDDSSNCLNGSREEDWYLKAEHEFMIEYGWDELELANKFKEECGGFEEWTI